MAEKTSHQKKYEKHVPEDARKHFRAASEEMRKSFEVLMPEGFMEHRRGARREMLMAWRSVLDAAIERMDDKV